MAGIFRIEMLPARQGDCLWIEYGEAEHPFRILIDGGTPATFTDFKRRVEELPEAERRFELLIISHIDNDHLGGTLKLRDEILPGLSFDDIWFNGWRHLPGSGFEEFGPVDAEKLTKWLDEPGRPWNRRFAGHTLVVKEGEPLPVIELSGGMKLTLLSPGVEELAALRPVWEEECRKANMDPAKPPPPPVEIPAGFEPFGVVDVAVLATTPFAPDPSAANGSAIAVLAEFDGRRALLAGDAHAGVLLANVERLLALEGQSRLALDAFKLPHHGSKANLSAALLEKIDARRYLFSTNGAQFRHPDKEAVARILCATDGEKDLIFNYRSEFNALWDSPPWKDEYHYRSVYPPTGQAGLIVEL